MALGALLLVVATVIAYLPALRAGFIWDDDQYVVENPTLRTAEGLVDIWTDPAATPQYYPLVHTSFWIEHHLWGVDPVGYHLVNVLLQALGAILLWQVLRRLGVPGGDAGAWVAAAVFALHPVNVESVAWVTERKNVLSGVFFFASLLAFLRFRPLGEPSDRAGSKGDRAGRGAWTAYGLSLGFFVCALLSKTVTATLPALLLVLIWWKTGRLAKRQVLPTLPFFAVGIPLGLLTVFLERQHVGAVGADWALSVFDRILIAGRVLWFYAGKLVWPHPLAFIYRRWAIDDTVWWQYLFPLAFLAVVAVLWRLRRRLGRGPLAGVLAFAGLLTPALGFVNVYPMRFSWAADHFQYLASSAFITLVVGLAARGAERLPGGRRTAAGIAAVVLVALGALTWSRCLIFHDRETLWHDTLEKTPTAWIAHVNFGDVLVEQKRYDEAAEHFKRALELNPDSPHAHYNLAEILEARGRLDEAIAHRKALIKINPKNADAMVGVARARLKQGRLDEAEDYYRQALAVDDGLADAHAGLARVLQLRGEPREAVEQASQALAIDPNNFPALFALASSFEALDRTDDAVKTFRRAREVARAAGQTEVAVMVSKRLRALGAS